MYMYEPTIIGYAIKTQNMVIDIDSLSLEEIAALNDHDLFMTFYIGKNGRHMARLPKNPKALFLTENSARDHAGKFMKGRKAEVVPVHEPQEPAIEIVRKTTQKQLPEIMEFTTRSKAMNHRKDKFRNYEIEGVKQPKARESGRIPKLK